jgi:hypothetical protein
VTLNLESALRHLRDEDKPRRPWIDTICINQSDIEERSKQVSRMLDIYKYARKVLIWLGKDHEDGDEKFRLGGNERNLGSASCTQKAFEFARRVEVVWKEKNPRAPSCERRISFLWI